MSHSRGYDLERYLTEAERSHFLRRSFYFLGAHEKWKCDSAVLSGVLESEPLIHFDSEKLTPLSLARQAKTI